ncbi:putative transporter YfdV [Falsiruegeria litorea R37]|uniref:Putative transporter YfdV n=1 Tax=Falsiruegeria litorea R37 TaxID=1200284 RepID=A0A1Y5R6Y7_9RHOB|nr:AEC family transporter [Falsiruegeria litorea]SLN10661.1 putative transporter YfdV [Falsiruegeria litorea R37]
MSTDILAITFPIYAAIAIGYVVVKLGWFGQSDMRTLGKYVMDIALPALLFNAMASRDFAEVFHPGYMLVFALGGLATILISYLWFTATRTEASRRAVAVMGTTCPNSGFIGYPVMLLTFPDLAGVILALNMLVENILLIPICLILMDLARGGEQVSISKRVIGILWGVLKRPMVIGLLLGLAVSVVRVPIPGPVTQLFQMLAASASALSLVVIGGSLAGLSLRGNHWKAAQVALGKLILHPGLVALAAVAVTAMGLSLSTELTAAVILSAAMPMFGIYSVLAQESGHEGMASIAMLIATAFGFVTLSVLLGALT